MKKINFLVRKKFNTNRFFLVICLSLSLLGLAGTVRNVHLSQFDFWSNREQSPVAPAQALSPAVKIISPQVIVAASKDELTELENKFSTQKILGVENLEREKSAKAIKITLNSDVFFQLGTAKIEEDSKESVLKIVDILRPVMAHSRIEIEGHTDDSPVMRQKVNYPSNWELSAARAASFIPLFANGGFFKDQIKVIAYGDSRPMFSNHTTKALSAKNRRIVLRVFAGG